MTPAQLPLRDVHLPPSPPWWPPAAGWWWVAAAVLLLVGLALWFVLRRRTRQRRWRQLFQRESAGDTTAARIGAMSALLRRAARRIDRHADTLQGEAWLQWLDGRDGQDFSQGPGRLLLDGGFRREVGASDLAALEPLAQRRFLQLMAGRR